MSRTDALRILAELRAGKQFVTRFQEQEWGLSHIGEDRFREWGHEADFSGRTEGRSFENIIDEEGVVRLLLQYNYERILGGLR